MGPRLAVPSTRVNTGDGGLSSASGAGRKQRGAQQSKECERAGDSGVHESNRTGWVPVARSRLRGGLAGVSYIGSLFARPERSNNVIAARDCVWDACRGEHQVLGQVYLVLTSWLRSSRARTRRWGRSTSSRRP